MANTRESDETSKPQRPPATTPEGRENQLIALAYDVAEEQLRSGKASSQLITMLMKSGTERERREREKLQEEVEYLKTKNESLKSAKNVESLYAEALAAMRTYSGQEQIIEDDDYDN